MRTTTQLMIAAALSALPFVAGASDAPVKPMDREKVKLTPTLVSAAQVKVSEGKYVCNNSGSSSAHALFTNTSASAENTYQLTWETTAPGACLKQGKCTPPVGGGLCIPPCLVPGSDVVKSYNSATPLVIAKGASKQAFETIPNAAYKKIVVKVAQSGATLTPTFDVVPTPVKACLF